MYKEFYVGMDRISGLIVLHVQEPGGVLCLCASEQMSEQYTRF